MGDLKRAFEKRHDELYAYHLPEQAPVLVNARVATVGRMSRLPNEPEPKGMTACEPAGTRRIYLDHWQEVPVYPFAELAPGQVVTGPAIVEADTTTVVLRPGDQAQTTAHQWLDIASAG
jgi:N-methylhydantoinase A